MRIYLLSLTVICLLSCSGGKPVDERFAFKPLTDSVFHFKVQIVDSSGPGRLKYQWIDFTLQKLAEKDSISTVRLVIDHLKITEPGITMAELKKGSIVILPAGTLVTLSTNVAESDKDAEGYYDSWKKILPKLKGDSLLVSMSHRGEIKQVTGFERITQKIATETGIGRATVRQLLYDYAGNESISDLLNQLFFYLPGKKVQQGEQWVKNVTMISKAPVKLSHLITVTEIDPESELVRLNIQSVMSAKTAEDGREYAEGKMRGKIVASQKTGLPIRVDLSQVITTHTDRQDRTDRRYIYITPY